MRRLVRIGGWTCVTLLVVGIGLFLLLQLAGGRVLRSAVNTFGPSLLGVPVTLREADLRPLRGQAHLQGLHVGNPEGYHTPALLDVAEITLELTASSLFRETIHVRRILIEAPQFTYERGNGESNLDRVLEQLGARKKKAAGGVPPTEPAPVPTPSPPPPQVARPGKKIIIDELVIHNPSLNASATILGGQAVQIALGDFAVREVGTKEGGVPIREALRTIAVQISTRIEENVDAVAGSLKQTLKSVEQSAQPLVDAFKDLFGRNKKDKKKAQP